MTVDILNILSASPPFSLSGIALLTFTAEYTPAEVIQQLLIDVGLGTDPDDSTLWPVFSPLEPSTPDDCIVVRTTTGVETGNDNTSGKVNIYAGVQILVRCRQERDGYLKARTLHTNLNQSIDGVQVTLGPTTYCVDMVTCVADVIDMNMNRPASRLSYYSVNALVDFKRVS